jgi:hypothetical protein
MVSIQLKYPRSSLPVNLLKVAAVLLGIIVGGPFVAALLHVLLGVGETASILATVAMLLSGVVLFMMTEDRDFDWETYRERGDHRVDALVVLAASGLGTGIGYLLPAATAFATDIQVATICGLAAAYEVFVARNRELFPPHVWPWFGSIYFRIRLDE